MIVKLDGNLDDDDRAIHAMMGLLSEIHATETDRRWKLHCGECQYIGPWATAVLAAAYLEGVRRQQRPRLVLPESPPALAAYCAFSGMRHLVRKEPLPSPEHPESETIRVEQFSQASWDRSNRIITLLRRHTELDAEREEQIRSCVQEVTQNIVDHAQSAIGGVMSARYMSASREVRVGIVDRGIGIAQSLAREYPDTHNSMKALQRVTQGGFTSRSRPNNMGIGVSNLFLMVKSAGGRMALFTGDAFAALHGTTGQTAIQSLGCDFPGTGVFFTLPTDA